MAHLEILRIIKYVIQKKFFFLNFYFLDVCNFPLGIEDGQIPDENFRASASHAEISSAKYARLNMEEGAGAWCHPTVEAGDETQYLEVS